MLVSRTLWTSCLSNQWWRNRLFTYYHVYHHHLHIAMLKLCDITIVYTITSIVLLAMWSRWSSANRTARAPIFPLGWYGVALWCCHIGVLGSSSLEVCISIWEPLLLLFWTLIHRTFWLKASFWLAFPIHELFRVGQRMGKQSYDPWSFAVREEAVGSCLWWDFLQA